jgi:hypothetical protein
VEKEEREREMREQNRLRQEEEAARRAEEAARIAAERAAEQQRQQRLAEQQEKEAKAREIEERRRKAEEKRLADLREEERRSEALGIAIKEVKARVEVKGWKSARNADSGTALFLPLHAWARWRRFGVSCSRRPRDGRSRRWFRATRRCTT